MNNFSHGDEGLEDNTTHRTVRLPLEESPEYQAAVTIWKTFPPCILLLGGFGNIATICVMRRIKDHNSSQHAILMALAVSDFTFLCTSPVHKWLIKAFHVDLQLLHMSLCKLIFWMVYVSGTTSAWLVTCVTVQRTMAVLWPHRMRVMCTVRKTWIVIIALVFTACALEFHLLLGMEISTENRCQTVAGTYRYFYVAIFSWVHLFMVSIAPSVCLLVCDILLSVTLFRAVSPSSKSARVDAKVTPGMNSDSRRRKASYRITVMVLAISCAFLVLTLPQCVYLIWSSYIHRSIKQHPLTIPMVNLVFAVTSHLWYVNSAINFYLYCLTGAKFRREFISWIRCGAQSPSAPSVHETASEASKGGRHTHPGNSPLSK